jgi:hypothetical protein
MCRPWYGRRRVARLFVWVATLIGLVWAAKVAGPFWTRYRYYRIQQQATTFLIGPSRVLMRKSTTQPYVYIAGPSDQFLKSFWTDAREAHVAALNPNSLRVLNNRISAATPIFCGARTTKGGNPQLVQVYSKYVPTCVVPYLLISVVTSDCYSWPWVATGRPGPKQIAGPGVQHGHILIPIGPSDRVEVCGGVANPGDQWETDVTIVCNGKPTTLRVHITEMSKSPLRVGIAIDRNTGVAGLGNSGGIRCSDILDWPFTGN